MAKSNRYGPTADNGISSRGKYTLVTSAWLPTTLWLAAVMALANRNHGSRPAKTNSGYGRPPGGAPATRPTNRLNTTIVANGCRTAQAAPRAVCL